MEASGDGLTLGLIWTALILGLRHGVDWDHIAAITDITGSQTDRRRAIFLSTLYALGHAVVVFVLGAIAVLAGDVIPPSVDSVMERIVGVTLILLGVYLVYSIVKHGGEYKIQSRWMLIINALRGLFQKRRARMIEIEHEHEHDHESGGHDHSHPLDALSAPEASLRTDVRTHTHTHVHRVPMPADPFTRYGRVSSFGVGMLHGVGAETPSQILLFVAAVGTAGRVAGIALLVAFLVGLLITNTAVAVASAYGFGPTRSRKVYVTVGITVAALSVALGSLYVMGRGDLLPGLL